MIFPVPGASGIGGEWRWGCPPAVGNMAAAWGTWMRRLQKGVNLGVMCQPGDHYVRGRLTDAVSCLVGVGLRSWCVDTPACPRQRKGAGPN